MSPHRAPPPAGIARTHLDSRDLPGRDRHAALRCASCTRAG